CPLLLQARAATVAGRNSRRHPEAGAADRRLAEQDRGRRSRMSQYTELLASIANTIQDYRGGSLPQPIPAHVERWVLQFDAAVQLPILQEIDHVLKNIYFSKEKVSQFMRGAIRTQKLTGDHAAQFWRNANFLDIQGGGDSQTDMLTLFSEQLSNELGFGIDGCGHGSDVFIYLDDGIFTGNRVRRDFEGWIRD